MTHQPVGYYYDYAIYHPECFPEEVDLEEEGASPIFEWEEDACSECSACWEPLCDCDDCL